MSSPGMAVQNSVKGTRLGVRQALTSHISYGKILLKPSRPIFLNCSTRMAVPKGQNCYKDRIIIF